MAKNLKLNVKNTQLSKVLKGLNKKVETPEKVRRESMAPKKEVDSTSIDSTAEASENLQPPKMRRAVNDVPIEKKEETVTVKNEEVSSFTQKEEIASFKAKKEASSFPQERDKETNFEGKDPPIHIVRHSSATRTFEPNYQNQRRDSRGFETKREPRNTNDYGSRSTSGFKSTKPLSFGSSTFSEGPRTFEASQKPSIHTGYREERRPSRDGGYSQRPPREEGYQNRPPREGGYAPREGRSNEGGYQNRPPREGGYQNRPPREGGYAPREGGYQNRPPREGGYPPREGGYQNRPPREGGYQNRPPREGGYPPREGGYQNRPPREGGYPPREGGYQNRPPREGGYPPREGGYQNRPPREGGYQNRSPGAPQRDGTRPPFERRPFAGTGSRPFAPRPQGPRPPFGGGQPFPPLTDSFSAKKGGTPYKGKPFASKSEEDKKRKRSNEGARSFDARDRHGLREADEGFHRTKFIPKTKAHRASLDISRPKEITIALPISVKDLAAEMKLKAGELLAKLLSQGLHCTLNDLLDDEVVVQLVGTDLGCEIKIDTSKQERLNISEQTVEEEISSADPSLLSPRAPVVTFMGHVDHGKTSLIDALRKSDLASKEAGAITQHMGAFSCHTNSGNITVLDTPGHEAFAAIRSRGAKVTDIVVLVVAGDEGFKIQTEEAIKHAKEADVAMIFAINKSDKEGYDPEIIYRQMADHELIPEAWGGTVPTVNCSALTGDGIEELVELLALQSEVLELKANPQARARGTTLEAQVVKGLGSCATLLVQNGTLKIGDAIVFGQAYGKIKLILDEHGHHLKEATPSQAVQVTGISTTPECGAEFIVVKNEKEARKISEQREAESRKVTLRKHSLNVGGMLQQTSEKQEKKIFNVILKADVQGSLEAMKTSLLKIDTKKVHIQIVSESIGMISLSDAELAKTSGAVIFGFHTKIDRNIEQFIRAHKVEVLLHDVIYHLIDQAKLLMKNLLDKLRVETEVGSLEVRATFKASALGVIAGCYVTEGIIKRSHFVRIYRGSEKVYEGDIASLKRIKEDVKEVSKGHECGVLLKNFDEIAMGDVIKVFEVSYVEQELV